MKSLVYMNLRPLLTVLLLALFSINSWAALVAEYRFEEDSWNGTSGEVKDSSSNGLDGTSINGANTDDTTPDPAINTDPGTCRYAQLDTSGTVANRAVEVSDNNTLDLASAFTLSAWIRHDRPFFNLDNDVILTKGLGDSPNYRLTVTTDTKLVLDWDGGSLTSSANIANTTWTHVAATFENGAQALYINGALDASDTETDTLSTNAGSLFIGKSSGGAFSDYRFSGQIDEVRIYDGALSLTEVQTIYSETHSCASFIANPEEFVLTTRRDSSLSGLGFRDRDLIRYDPSDDSATFIATPEASGGKTDANAIHFLDSGNIVYSFNGANQTDNSSGTSVTVTKADLLEYNPVTDEISFYLMGEYFDNDRNVASNIMRDIDALYIVDDDTIIISTQSTASIENSSGSTLITVGAGDLVELTIDRNTHTVSAATMFFEEGVDYTHPGSGNGDITGFHIKDDGNYLFNFGTTDFSAGDYVIGGYSVDNWNDVIEYDPTTGLAGLYFDGGKITPDNDSDIDGLSEYAAPTVPPASELIVLATRESETLGGLSFTDDDAVLYDPNDNVSTLYFDGANFSNTEQITAFSMLDNGNYILSTGNSASLGGLSFGDDDLVEYNPNTDTATLYRDLGSETGADIDVNGVHVFDNGDIVFSTKEGFGAYADEDLVLYDASSDSFSIYLDTSTLGTSIDVNGFYIRDNGNVLLTFRSNTTVQGVSVLDGDIVEYNPSDGSASIYFSESEFSDGADIMAIHLIQVDTSCTLGSFAITQPANGLACPSTRSTISITAMCDDGTTVKDDYAGTIDLTTNENSQSEFYLASSGGSAVTSVTLDGSESGTVDVYLFHQNENSDLKVTAADSSASVSTEATTGTDYRTAGLVVTDPGDFICGTSSETLTITAIGQDDSASASCSRLTGFTGNKNLKAWFTINVDPQESPEVADPVSSNLSIGGGSFSDNSEPASNNIIDLTFTNGQATADVAYPDSGHILSVNFKHDEAPYDGTFPALLGSSGDFVVSPNNYVVTASDTGSDCAAADASCSRFRNAGESFTLNIAAACSGGGEASSYQGDVDISHSLVAPVTGDPGTRGASEASISSGNIDVAQTISEVGVFTFSAAQKAGTDYFGKSISQGTSANVGRFSPASFDVVISATQFSSSCGAFTYVGQAFRYVTGSTPSITIEAQNTGGNLTQNYEGDFWLLGSSLGEDCTNTNGFCYTDNSGIVSTSIVPPTASQSYGGTTDNGGSVTFTLHQDEDFTYSRPASAIAPFDADVALDIALRDSDGITGSGQLANILFNIDTGPTNDQTLRYGRLALENAYGPENRPLALTLRSEYWDGSQFVDNTDDSCTAYDSAQLTNTDNLLNSATTTPSGNGILSNGFGTEMILSAPGLNNWGTSDLDYSSDTWLMFDWNGTGEQGPSATATFGQYRGNDRIIYWREVTP